MNGQSSNISILKELSVVKARSKTVSTVGTHRAAPERLRGHIGFRVDLFKLRQSLFLDLLQMLLQREVSVREKPVKKQKSGLRAVPEVY